MSVDKLENILEPGEARAAERHLRARWGEATVDAPSGEANAELLAELDAADETLAAVLAMAAPSPEFAKRVMAALPEASSEPAIFVAQAKRSSPWRLALIGSALAAAVALAVIGAWREIVPTPQDSGILTAQVMRGELADESGKAVESIQPGKLYRTGEREVVLRLDEGSAMRIAPRSRFQTLEPGETRRALLLQQGSLYAHEAGEKPLLVRAEEFDTEIKGVSWVLREGQERAGLPAMGIVLVFKGHARIHGAEHFEPLLVEEGEVYVTGEAYASPQDFAARTEERIATLQDAQPVSLAEADRTRYAKVVQGYEEELDELDARIARHEGQPGGKELKVRRSLVERYLAEHRMKLNQMPGEASESKAQEKVRHLQRALENVEQGRLSYTDPAHWL